MFGSASSEQIELLFHRRDTDHQARVMRVAGKSLMSAPRRFSHDHRIVEQSLEESITGRLKKTLSSVGVVLGIWICRGFKQCTPTSNSRSGVLHYRTAITSALHVVVRALPYLIGRDSISHSSNSNHMELVS